jgi:predicted permease
MLSDLKYAIRSLLKNPWFTAVVIVTLALGIGANTTVFSWARAVLLHPLRGVADAERLLTLETLTPAGGYIDSSYPDFRDYRDQSQSLAGVIAFHDRPLSFGANERPERVWAEFVSGNFFEVLGVKPVAGRFFRTEEQEEVPGKHAVAVISEPFWQRHFNADPAVIGKTIRLNGHELTVLGVAPAQFAGTIVGLSFDVWVPLMMSPSLSRAGNWLDERRARGLHLMGRLKPGVSTSKARAEIQTIARRTAQIYPESNEGIGATLLPIREAPYGVQSRIGTLLEILLGAGTVLLLIVCANVANLLLARATVRQKEFGIRLALGASRQRVIGQLLVESLLLAGLGGVLGVLLAMRMTDFLRFFIPATTLPIAVDFPIDSAVLAFTLLVSMLAGVIFGLVPALQTVGSSRLTSLRNSSRGSKSSARSHRWRGMLVVSEVALALLALIGAGLFLNSFHHAKRIDPGFEPANVLLAAMNLSEQGYDRERGLIFLRRLRERVATLPGVRAVSYSEDVPLGFDGGSWEEVQVSGYVPRRGEDMKIYRNPIAPGYFGLMRIPLVEGRDFTGRDDVRAPPVAIINQTFAQRFFPGQMPLGRKMHAWGLDWTVVGIVKDIKYQSLRESPQPYFYLPLEQFYQPTLGLALHVRTAGPPENLLPTLHRELRSLDPGVTLFEILKLSDYIGAAWFAQKIAATLLSVLSALSLLLAALGLFSVMAYTVSQRTHEIGIRMALGAQTSDVLHSVLDQSLRVVFAGIVIGLALSFALMPLVASQLLGVSAMDPLTFIAVVLLLIATSVIACWLPAWRATHVDPLVTLRTE